MTTYFKERAKWSVLMLALLAILGGLAAMQYRWSKRLTEAVRARIDASLQASLMDWHLSLLRQIAEPCFAMQINSEPGAKEDWNKYYRRYQSWLRTAEFPGLFANLYLVKVSRDHPEEIQRYDLPTGRFLPAHWDPSFEILQAELRRQSSDPEGLERRTTDDLRTKVDNLPGAMPHDPLFGWQFEQNLPALIHPLTYSDAFSDPRDEKFQHQAHDHAEAGEVEGDDDKDDTAPVSWIVIQLDPQVLQQQLLPDLARHYFGGPQSSNYDYAVVEGRNGRVLYASDRALLQRPVDNDDIVFDVFGAPPSGQALLAHDYAGDFHVDGQTKPTLVEERRNLAGPMWFPVVPDVPSGVHWNLIVRPKRGSLDVQMGAMRQRDFAIGLGVLILLAIATSVLFVATRRAQRLAQLQMSFVATVSHELRTPLSVICSAADNLAAGIVTDKLKVINYGDTIKAQGQHLADLLERILLFSSMRERQQIYRLEFLDVRKILAALTANTSALLSLSGIRLECHLQENIPEVLVDLSAISHCLQNLVINAVKYGGDSKWIGISVSRAHTPTSREVRIAVQDRGIGIAPSPCICLSPRTPRFANPCRPIFQALPWPPALLDHPFPRDSANSYFNSFCSAALGASSRF